MQELNQTSKVEFPIHTYKAAQEYIPEEKNKQKESICVKCIEGYNCKEREGGIVHACSHFKGMFQGDSKKPQNFDEMVVMYMDMLINHRMMETRLHNAEEQIEKLVFELNDLKISIIDNNNRKFKTKRRIYNGISHCYRNRKK